MPVGFASVSVTSSSAVNTSLGLGTRQTTIVCDSTANVFFSLFLQGDTVTDVTTSGGFLKPNDVLVFSRPRISGKDFYSAVSCLASTGTSGTLRIWYE